MNFLERAALIDECQSYLFPSSSKKLAENKPVNHLVLGMIESDRQFLNSLTDLELIHKATDRADLYLGASNANNKRRKTNAENAKRKKGKLSKITRMVEIVVRSNPGGMAQEYFYPLKTLLESEDMEPLEGDGHLSLTYLDEHGKRKPYSFSALSAAASRIKRKRGI